MSAGEVVTSGALGLTGALSVLFCILALDHLRAQRRAHARLARFGLLDAVGSEGGAGAALSATDLVRHLGAFVSRWAKPEYLYEMRTELRRANLQDRLSVEDLLGFRVLGTVLGLALGALVGVALGPYALATAAIGACLGYIAPRWALTRLAQQRRQAVDRLLPDAVDVLVVSLGAGLGFDSAVGFLCERARNELTLELQRYQADFQLGRSRREALERMVERTQSPDLRAFAAAVIQAEELGTGLANTLQAQARTLRATRRLRAEELARQAPVKLLFPMILCIMPVLFIVIVGPALIQALTVFGGS